MRDNSSRVEFELPMLEVWVRVPVVATIIYLEPIIFASLVDTLASKMLHPPNLRILHSQN